MIVRSLAALRESRADMTFHPLDKAFKGTRLYELLGGLEGSTISVNERTAMNLTAVGTCVNIICGAIASLPLKVYQRQDRGRRVAREHRLYPLLHDAPSPEDTSYNFRHKMQGNTLLAGNGYAETERDNANRVRAFYHHPAGNVRVELGDRRGLFRYIVNDASGERRVKPENMIHLRGFTHEGIAGMSAIQNYRRSLGIAVRTEVFAQNFYDNGARASGVLMYPGKLSEKGKTNLTESFEEKHKGADKAGKTILLEEGTKYQQLTIPPDDAQFLQTRQLSRAEIAGIFRVPTMLVPGADDTPPTYASSEQFMRYFVDFCLRDWLTLWQQELNNKLFSGSEFYCEFDLRDLLRGDATARAQLYKARWEIGSLNADTIAEYENENPIPGGDRYYVPLNWVPVDRVDDQLDAKPAADAGGSTADGGRVQDTSQQGQRQFPKGYRRLFAGMIREIQQWNDFKESRAVAKLLPLLRAMADDLQPKCSDAFISEYVTALALRVKSVSDADAEIERACEEIRIYHSVDEVPDHVPEKYRKQWLEIWNKTYKQAKSDGLSDQEAESKAFTYANGVIKKEDSA